MSEKILAAWTGGYWDTLAILGWLAEGKDVQPIYLAQVDSRLSGGREMAAMRALRELIAGEDLPGRLLPLDVRGAQPPCQEATQAYNELMQVTAFCNRMPPHWEMLARLARRIDGELVVAVSPQSRAWAFRDAGDEVVRERFWKGLRIVCSAPDSGWDRVLRYTWTCSFPTPECEPCGQCRDCTRRPVAWAAPKGWSPASEVQLSVIQSVKDRSRHPVAGELFPRSVRSICRAAKELGLAVELVVVDWQSADWPLREWLPQLCEEAGLSLTVAEKAGEHNLGAGRNAGAAKARGGALLFLDADMLVSGETLRHAYETAMAGKVYAPICYSLANQASVGAWRGSIPTTAEPGGRGSWGNLAIARWLWEASGGWTEKYVGWGPEDVEFRERVLAFGWPVHREPEPTLIHQWHPPDRGNPEHLRGSFPTAPMPTKTVRLLREFGLWGMKQSSSNDAKPERELDALPGKMPRVLLLCDVPNWAFDRNQRDMAKALKDRVQCDHWYMSGPTGQAEAGPEPDLDAYDCFVVPYHFRVGPHLPLERVLFGQNSQYLWMDRRQPPQEKEVAFARRHGGFYVTNQRAQKQYRTAGLEVQCLPNPVDMDRHPKMTKAWDELRPCWVGNSQRRFGGERHSAKHFEDMVVPACRDAGLLLEFHEYHKPRLSSSRMAAWYLRSNCYVCASEHEGCSNAIMEAMASGLVIVTTDAGAIPEIYLSQKKHFGESGIFVCKRSRESIGDALKGLSRRSLSELRRLGSLNREEVARRWSWSAWADAYCDAILRVARPAKKTAAPQKQDKHATGSPRKKSSRIALICWAGHDALADDLIGGVTKAEFERLGCEVDMGPWPTRIDHLVKRFKGCDAVVFGGGSLICPTKMYPMGKVREWVHRIGRPLHILGPGFRKETDLLSDEQRELNAFLFSAAKTSWVRGLVTQTEMERNGLSFEHHGHGDPGVLHDVESTVDLAGPGPRLCMIVRDMPDVESKNVPNELTHEFFRRLCVRWHRDTGGSLHFVSWRHFRVAYDNDFEAANEVVASLPLELRKRAHVHKPKDWVEAAEITCAGDAVASQRLHPTIVALTNGVPAVGLDYQFRKMEDFASVVNYEYWLDTSLLAESDDKINACVASAIRWLTEGVDYPRVKEALRDVSRLLREHMRRRILVD